jgi:protein required for attachment to host cells
VLGWLKTVVVTDREKVHLRRQVGTKKTFQTALGWPWLADGVAVEAS